VLSVDGVIAAVLPVAVLSVDGVIAAALLFGALATILPFDTCFPEDDNLVDDDGSSTVVTVEGGITTVGATGRSSGSTDG
jgi:hypothetical protein